MRSREIAVATLAVGISAYEILCRNEETISEFFDPHMEQKWKQALVVGLGAVTLAHIANLLPESKDPFEKGLSPIRQAYRRRYGSA